MKNIEEAKYEHGICYYKYRPQKKASLEICKQIVEERKLFSEAYGDKNATITDVTQFEGAERKGMIFWSKPESGIDIVALVIVHKSDTCLLYTSDAADD